MIAPIQMFDVNAINTGRQHGMQRGAVNSPFTPLGQALDKTLQKYEAGIVAQQKSASDASLLGVKNIYDQDLQKTKFGYDTGLQTQKDQADYNLEELKQKKWTEMGGAGGIKVLSGIEAGYPEDIVAGASYPKYGGYGDRKVTQNSLGMLTSVPFIRPYTGGQIEAKKTQEFVPSMWGLEADGSVGGGGANKSLEILQQISDDIANEAKGNFNR